MSTEILPVSGSDILFIDVETTGLRHQSHEIIQIGAVLVDALTLKPRSELNLLVKPERLYTADEKALQLNHYEPGRWAKEGLFIKNALTELVKFAGPNAIMAGWNVSFDWAFLAEAFYRSQMDYPFHYHRYDIMSMAAFLVSGANLFLEPREHSLRAVAALLGIENKKAHDANQDAWTTYWIFNQLVENNFSK